LCMDMAASTRSSITMKPTAMKYGLHTKTEGVSGTLPGDINKKEVK